MSVKYILESGIMERRDIHSGRIYKEGSPPKYGVIFSSNEEKSEDDLGLDPELMLGAYLGLKDAPNEEQDRFFQILGGYFFHDNYPDPGTTTKVFGIALEPEFGLEEGGTITLKDKWKLDDPDRPILDESHWSEQFGKHHGWTFIVTLKEREKYPHSDEMMKIIVYCPEITNLSVAFGQCVTEGDVRRRKVTFAISIQDGPPDNWIFHFGDGETKSGDGAPPSTIEYFYHKKPETAPKFCLKGSEPCNEVCQDVDMSGFEECLPCPEIKSLECKSIARDKNIETFEFRAELSRSPDKFQWDFGDGSPLDETTEPVTQHEYKILDRDSTYSVKMTGIGPEDCKQSKQESITVRRGFVESKYCFWLQLLVSFLIASTFGVFITYCAAKISGQSGTNYTWLILIFIILALLSGIAIFLWYRFVSRKLCPAPGKCDWLKISWIALLAGVLVAFYALNICPGWWWIVIIILLVGAGLLIYRWYKTCLIIPGRLFLSLVACVLSVLFVCIFIASPVFSMLR